MSENKICLQAKETGIPCPEPCGHCEASVYLKSLDPLPEEREPVTQYKKRYTIGALFSVDLADVLLIRKERPEWQRGKFNLPGGHIEEDETSAACVRREFQEEVGLDISDWKHIGRIDNPGNYYVDFFAAVEDPSQPMSSLTDEHADWFPVYELPAVCISNIFWLVPFARNVLEQGNSDYLTFGNFTYEYR